MKRKLSILILLPFIWACSSEPKEVKNEAHGEPRPVPQTSMEAKQLAAEQNSPYVAEITFKKGSKDLNADAKQRLTELMKKVKGNFAIDQVKVVAWADEEYPSEGTQKLAKGQTEIADQRSETLKKYLNDQNPDWKIATYNMAERPSSLDNFLGTADARIKKSLESAGVKTSEDKKGKISKASKAIVMLVPEGSKSE